MEVGWEKTGEEEKGKEKELGLVCNTRMLKI